MSDTVKDVDEPPRDPVAEIAAIAERLSEDDAARLADAIGAVIGQQSRRVERAAVDAATSAAASGSLARSLDRLLDASAELETVRAQRHQRELIWASVIAGGTATVGCIVADALWGLW